MVGYCHIWYERIMVLKGLYAEKNHLQCESGGGACGHSIGSIWQRISLAGFLVTIAVWHLPSTKSAPMSAIDLLILVHNSDVLFQVAVRAELWVTWVTRKRKGVALCVTPGCSAIFLAHSCHLVALRSSACSLWILILSCCWAVSKAILWEIVLDDAVGNHVVVENAQEMNGQIVCNQYSLNNKNENKKKKNFTFTGQEHECLRWVNIP